MLDPYRSFVLETLQRYPGLVSTRIYDMLSERGYTGSLRTLRRFVLLHRPDVPREVYVRIETLAGEQSQIDWAHVGHLRVPGGTRSLYCFVLLLRHSRAMWAELVLEQTTASLLRSLVRAAPDVCTLLPSDGPALAELRCSFVRELVHLAELADDVPTFVCRARRLGAVNHRRGVRLEHFAAAEQALVAALASTLGDDLTPEAERAWRRLSRPPVCWRS